jgi:hypothetical protein
MRSYYWLNNMIYRIEIRHHLSLVEVCEADDIQEILAWYRFNWYSTCDSGLCVFHVYRYGIELTLDELCDLGFYK